MNWLKSHKKMMVIGLITLFVLSILYLFLGYGYINLPNSNTNSAVFVDNTYRGNNLSDIKLRPGKHVVVISEPSSKNTQKIIVLPFIKRSLDTKSVSTDYKRIMTDLLDANNYTITNIDGVQFNETWYGAVVTTNKSVEILVLQFRVGQWQLIYRGDGLDDEFISAVPLPLQKSLDTIAARGFND